VTARAALPSTLTLTFTRRAPALLPPALPRGVERREAHQLRRDRIELRLHLGGVRDGVTVGVGVGVGVRIEVRVRVGARVRVGVRVRVRVGVRVRVRVLRLHHGHVGRGAPERRGVQSGHVTTDTRALLGTLG